MPAIRGWGRVFLHNSGFHPSLFHFPELVINDEAQRGILRVCKWHRHGQQCLWEHNHFAVFVSRELSGAGLCHNPSSWGSGWLRHEIYLSGVCISFNLCCAIFIQWDILKFDIIKEFQFPKTYDFLHFSTIFQKCCPHGLVTRWKPPYPLSGSSVHILTPKAPEES